MILTVFLIIAIVALSILSAWTSGHAKEFAKHNEVRIPLAEPFAYGAAIVGLTSAIFSILLPILLILLTDDDAGAGYAMSATGDILGSLTGLYVFIAIALLVAVLLITTSLRQEKPKNAKNFGRDLNDYYEGHNYYPRSHFIFISTNGHRRRAHNYHYAAAARNYQANASMAGGMGNSYAGVVSGRMSGGVSNAASNYGMRGGFGGNYSSSSMRGGMGGSYSPSGMRGGFSSDYSASGMRGGMGNNSASGMSGGMSSSSSNYKKSSNSSSNNYSSGNSASGKAGLAIIIIMAALGGFYSARALRNMGGKRQAELNDIWSLEEARRVIREYEEEQEAKLQARFAELDEIEEFDSSYAHANEAEVLPTLEDLDLE